MTKQSGFQSGKHGHPLFAQGRQVSANASERLSTRHGAKTS